MPDTDTPRHTDAAQHTDTTAHESVPDPTPPVDVPDSDVWTFVYGLGLLAILLSASVAREWWTRWTAGYGARTDGAVKQAAEHLNAEHLTMLTDVIANGVETWRTGRSMGEVAARIQQEVLVRGIVPKRSEVPPGVDTPAAYVAWLLDQSGTSVQEIARTVIGDGITVGGERVTPAQVSGTLLTLLKMRGALDPAYHDSSGADPETNQPIKLATLDGEGDAPKPDAPTEEE